MTAAESVVHIPERPGEFFTWDEFKCHDRMETPYPIDWRPTRGVILGAELDRIRRRVGPYSPTSVHRTFEYHAGIYRAMRPPQPPPIDSQHLYGRAGDVPNLHLSWTEFQVAVIAAAKEPGSQIRYIKFYRTQSFAHVDCRQTATLKVEYATI